MASFSDSIAEHGSATDTTSQATVEVWYLFGFFYKDQLVVGPDGSIYKTTITFWSIFPFWLMVLLGFFTLLYDKPGTAQFIDVLNAVDTVSAVWATSDQPAGPPGLGEILNAVDTVSAELVSVKAYQIVVVGNAGPFVTEEDTLNTMLIPAIVLSGPPQALTVDTHEDVLTNSNAVDTVSAKQSSSVAVAETGAAVDTVVADFTAAAPTNNSFILPPIGILGIGF